MSGEPVFRRGKIWWCRVRSPHGGRHIRISTGCKDRKAAVGKWRELERKVVSGTDPRTNSPPLAEALGRRLDERRSAGRSEGTLQMIQSKSRHLTRLMGAQTVLNRIDARTVDAYVEARLDEGAARTTIYKELVTLRGALKLARRRGEYAHPLDQVMPEFSAKYVPKERALSLVEIRKLMGSLSEARAALVGLIVAVAATYPSEIADMRKEDIDLKGGTVRIRGTKTEKRARKVPIVDFARDWVVQAKPFVPFTPWANVRRDMLIACSKAGIVACCPTDLRRTMLTLLRAKGVEPSLLGIFAGHADSRMVERVYGRLGPEQLGHLLSERLAGPVEVQRRPKEKPKPHKKRSTVH